VLASSSSPYGRDSGFIIKSTSYQEQYDSCQITARILLRWKRLTSLNPHHAAFSLNATILNSRSLAPPVNALLPRLCLASQQRPRANNRRGRPAEPAIQWVPRQSLGTSWWRSARSCKIFPPNGVIFVTTNRKLLLCVLWCVTFVTSISEDFRWEW